MDGSDRQIISAFRQLRGPGLFTPLDLHFADFAVKLDRGYAPGAVFAAAAMISHASSSLGHVCLDLQLHCNKTLDSFFADLPEASAEKLSLLQKTGPPGNWLEQLLKSPAVGTSESAKLTPLILESGRLYLQKYYRCEQELAGMICDRAANPNPILPPPDRLNSISPFLRPEVDGDVNWQTVAVFAALYNSFTIITGPPGAGKTSIAATICALLLEQQPDIKIALCAPTGKAQTVLKSSIRRELENLHCADEVKLAVTALPTSTIHRLLGSIKDSTRFRHDRDNPLNLDVLIIDESSMAPLLLLTRLFQALPEHTRVIMLGDKDQLASVESGAVLNDISNASELNIFSEQFIETFKQASGIPLAALEKTTKQSPLTDCAVKLQKVFRFSSQRGIGLIQRRICNLPEAPAAFEIEELISDIADSDPEQISLRQLPETTADLQQLLNSFIADLRKSGNFYMDAKTPNDALSALKRFIILSPQHSGLLGVSGINDAMCEVLDLPVGRLAHGMPVMITRNAYDAGLFNGDIGIIMRDDSGSLKAWFNNHHYETDSQDSSPVISFPLNRLPRHTTAFAITVHKSQGSGFERVLLLLPDSPARSLAVRELFYTALTRTSRRLDICATPETLRNYLVNRTSRTSGLEAALNRNIDLR